jgi:hypothetical protein
MIEIKKEGTGAYHFYLKTKDGISLLKSIDFSSREELNGIVENLHALMEDPMVFERQTNHTGKFLFQLKDKNGRPLGNSQLYNSEAGMENGIKNLKNSIASLRKDQNS